MILTCKKDLCFKVCIPWKIRIVLTILHVLFSKYKGFLKVFLHLGVMCCWRLTHFLISNTSVQKNIHISVNVVCCLLAVALALLNRSLLVQLTKCKEVVHEWCPSCFKEYISLGHWTPFMGLKIFISQRMTLQCQAKADSSKWYFLFVLYFSNTALHVSIRLCSQFYFVYCFYCTLCDFQIERFSCTDFDVLYGFPIVPRVNNYVQ